VPILIDGHNLIGRSPEISLQDPDDEAKLVAMLRSYQARTGKAITVVFDSGGVFALPRSGRWGAVNVRFAPQGSSADALIARRVRQSRQPESWLVVTSDRELAEAVTTSGARVQSSEAFASELRKSREVQPGERDAPLPPEEVEAWLALFETRD
jgi:predicted RNA-binding protein with PIN domain